MGMPGLGALGVTFDSVVAMDSPDSRTPGSFHWASTLWHELSHVYVLNMTKSRVPRWFTEGLAVYEETAASPDWGDRLDPEAIEPSRQKAAADCRDRPWFHSSHVSGAGDRFVFSGGEDLQFYRSEVGLRQAARDDSRLRGAEIDSRSDRAGIQDEARGIR